MAHSTFEANQVLIYNELTDQARWHIKSFAMRLCAADPFVKIIEQDDDNYEAVAKLAGPKPHIYIQSNEDYGTGDD